MSAPNTATSLAKDFGLTLPFERNTLVGTLETNPPPPTTTWTPTFGAPPIPEDPKQPYRPLELHYSTSTSTYQGHPSSSMPMSSTSVPTITQRSRDQIYQNNTQGHANTIPQSQTLMQIGTYLPNPLVGSSIPLVSQGTSIINPPQDNPLVTNPINQSNTLFKSLSQGNPQDMGQGNICKTWTQGINVPLTL